MTSDDEGLVNQTIQAKGYFLTLAQGNPRLAVFEWDENENGWVNIYQDNK